jgi:hypothetical protein
MIPPIVTMFEQNGLAMGMVVEKANGLGAAVTAESDNSDGDWHVDIYSVDCIIIPKWAGR